MTAGALAYVCAALHTITYDGTGAGTLDEVVREAGQV